MYYTKCLIFETVIRLFNLVYFELTIGLILISVSVNPFASNAPSVNDPDSTECLVSTDPSTSTALVTIESECSLVSNMAESETVCNL